MSTSLRFLDHHWTQLAHAASTTAALRRWAAETALLAAGSGDELLDRIRTATVADADAILAQLAERAPTDRTAAELLLHALRPGLGRLARRHHRRDRSDIGQDLAAIARERIRTYPCDRRPARIAANVLLDTLNRYLATQRSDTHLTRLTHDLEQPPTDHPDQPPTRDQATAHLDWAVTRQVITPATAHIVHRLHIDHHPIATVAADLGVTTDTLNRRRRRALIALQTLPHPTPQPSHLRPAVRHSPATRHENGGVADGPGTRSR